MKRKKDAWHGLLFLSEDPPFIDIELITPQPLVRKYNERDPGDA
jgi:hypothetical protein